MVFFRKPSFCFPGRRNCQRSKIYKKSVLENEERRHSLKQNVGQWYNDYKAGKFEVARAEGRLLTGSCLSYIKLTGANAFIYPKLYEWYKEPASGWSRARPAGAMLMPRMLGMHASCLGGHGRGKRWFSEENHLFKNNLFAPHGR